MLQQTIRIKELSSYGSYLGPQSVADHFFEPIFVYDIRVVV